MFRFESLSIKMEMCHLSPPYIVDSFLLRVCAVGPGFLFLFMSLCLDWRGIDGSLFIRSFIVESCCLLVSRYPGIMCVVGVCLWVTILFPCLYPYLNCVIPIFTFISVFGLATFIGVGCWVCCERAQHGLVANRGALLALACNSFGVCLGS